MLAHAAGQAGAGIDAGLAAARALMAWGAVPLAGLLLVRVFAAVPVPAARAHRLAVTVAVVGAGGALPRLLDGDRRALLVLAGLAVGVAARSRAEAVVGAAALVAAIASTPLAGAHVAAAAAWAGVALAVGSHAVDGRDAVRAAARRAAPWAVGAGLATAATGVLEVASHGDRVGERGWTAWLLVKLAFVAGLALAGARRRPAVGRVAIAGALAGATLLGTLPAPGLGFSPPSPAAAAVVDPDPQAAIDAAVAQLRPTGRVVVLDGGAVPAGTGPVGAVVVATADAASAEAALLDATALAPERGIVLAPWLLDGDLLLWALRHGTAQVTIPLAWDPAGAAAAAYLRWLDGAAPDEAPSAAGYGTWLDATDGLPDTEGGGVRLYTAAAFQIVPGDVGHGHGGPSWVEGGGLAAISPRLET